jgi:hypothetical protein
MKYVQSLGREKKIRDTRKAARESDREQYIYRIKGE